MATRREKKRTRFSNLPPCTICGDKASGLHYGVNACEACKVFFYRNIKRVELLGCEATRSCQPDPNFAFTCAACRMTKCLASGMTLEGTRRGRYSFERRASLRKPLDTSLQTPNFVTSEPTVTTFLTQRDDHCGDKLATMTEPTPSNTLTDSLNSSMAIVPQDKAATEHEHTTLGKNRQNKTLNSTHDSDTVVTSDEKNAGEITCVVASLASHEDIPQLKESEILDMSTVLKDLYTRHSIYPPDYFEKVKEAQQLYLETENEKRRIFGKMEPLPMHEFLEIYHKTGMDIDGRIWFVKQSYPEMEESCLKYIHYAQELPGFDKFVKEDQISILKGAKSSYWMLADYSSLNIENGLVTSHNYVTVKREEFLSEILVTGLFMIGEKLQKCDLTFDEVNVLRAIVLFNPELCVTEKGKLYAEKQSAVLLQVLRYLLDKNHPDENLMDELLNIKKEMLDFDHTATTQWRYYFSLYNVLIRQDADERSQLPFMQVLYELPTKK